MPWIYRYRDLKDNNKIKYVGLVYDDSKAALRNRIRQHKSDIDFCHENLEHWYLSMDEYEVDVLTPKVVKTKNDAEMLEGHFISVFGTQNYLNKAKSSWGESSYLKDVEFDWIPYTDICPSSDVIETIKSLQKENQQLKQEIIKLKDTIKSIKAEKALTDLEIEKLKDIGAKEWRRQRQAEGIAAAKARAAYHGRKPMQIDDEKFKTMCQEWVEGKRTATSIQEEFHITGTTFYRWIKNGFHIDNYGDVKFGRPSINKPDNWDSVYSDWRYKKITAEKAIELTGLKRTTFYKLAEEQLYDNVVECVKNGQKVDTEFIRREFWVTIDQALKIYNKLVDNKILQLS